MVSFGGSQYTLEYLIKVTGGTQGASQVNAVNTSLKQSGMAGQQASQGFNTASQSVMKNRQAVEQHSKAMKGLAFGMIGLVTAGAEMGGMLSMYQSTVQGTAEAHANLDRALKESGKNSKDYKDAVSEVSKAERWASMVRRNLILSTFDLVPFVLLTINALAKLRNLHRGAGAAVAPEIAANEALTAALAKNTVAIEVNNAAKASGVASARTFTAAQSQAALATATSTGAFTKTSIALGAGSAAASVGAVKVGALSGIFSKVASAAVFLVTKIGPIAIAIGLVLTAIKAWKENWGGFGDAVNQAGVQIGNIHPILKSLMEIIGKVSSAIGALMNLDFAGAKEAIFGKAGTASSMGMSKADEKALEDQKKRLEDYINFREDLGDELVDMKKKERKEAFFDMGFKGKEDNSVMKSLKKLDEFKNKVTGFVKGFSQIEQISILDKLGFKGMDKEFEKFFYTWEDRFDELGHMIKKGTMFEGIDIKKSLGGLEKKFKEAAKNPSEGPKIIADYLANHQEIIHYLEATGLHDVAAHLQSIVDSAVGDQMAKNEQALKTFHVGSKPMGGENLLYKTLGFSSQAEYEAATMSDAEKAGADWGKGLLAGMIGSITPSSANSLGQAIRNQVILPVVNSGVLWAIEIGTAISTGLQKFFSTFDLGAAITSTNAAVGTGSTIVLDFLAGLFGFGTWIEVLSEINNFFTNTVPIAIRVAWTNFSTTMTSMVPEFMSDETAPVFTIGAFLGSIFGTLPEILAQGKVWFDANIIAPIITTWETVAKGIGALLTAPAETVTTGLTILSSMYTGIFGTIGEIVSGFGQWVIDNIIEPIVGDWDSKMSTIGNLFGVATPTTFNVETWITPIFGDISEIVSTFSQWVIDNLIEPLVGAWDSMMGTIGGLFTPPTKVEGSNLGDIVSSLMPSIFGDISDIVTTFTEWIEDNVVQPLVDEWGKFWGGIGSLFTLPEIKIGGINLDFIGEFAGSLFGDITNIVTEFTKWITDNIVTPLVDEWNKFWSGIGSLFNIGGGDNKDQKPLIDQAGSDLGELLLGNPFAHGDTGDNKDNKDTDKSDKLILASLALDTDNALQKVADLQGRANLLATPQVITLDNSAAGQILTGLGNTIIGIAGLNPQITLDDSAAGNTLAGLANTIVGLENLQPEISLQDKEAGKTLSGVAKTIEGLTNIKPKISLQNKGAIHAVDTVAQRIEDLGNINPTVHVGISGPGAQFVEGAAHGMHKTLAKDTLIQAHKGERVDIGPSKDIQNGFTNFSAPDTGNTGTVVVHNHNHYLEREVIQIMNIEKGRMISRMG